MHSRYSKQILLPEVGKEGQAALRNARVLCVGAGGLGSPLLLYLAAAGVGKLGVMDHDNVELSNLHRQILFQESHIHLKKAECAKERLSKLNSDILIESHPEKLTPKNVSQVFLSYDIIVDATDHFESKYLINDAAVKLNKKVVYGSTSGLEGQVSLFEASRGPCLRCVYPQAPSRLQSCEVSGILGPVAGLVASIQATECLKFILNPQSPVGVLLNIDAFSMNILKSKIKKSTTCPTCSIAPEHIHLRGTDAHCLSVSTISAAEALDKSENYTLIDIRETHELKQSPYPLFANSLHLPLSIIKTSSAKVFQVIPKSKPLIVYCQNGGRSAEAAHLLENAGFSNVKTLRSGIERFLLS